MMKTLQVQCVLFFFFLAQVFLCLLKGMYCDVRRKVSQVINSPLGYSWKFALHLGNICCYGQQLEFEAIPWPIKVVFFF